MHVKRLTNEGVEQHQIHMLQTVKHNHPAPLLAVASFSCQWVWKSPGGMEKALSHKQFAVAKPRGCEAPTVHVGHLPVRDVHLLIIPQGQWECDSVTGCKHSGDVGLHHLQEEAEMGISGICTLPEQTQGTAPELCSPQEHQAASAQLWEPMVGFDPPLSKQTTERTCQWVTQ